MGKYLKDINHIVTENETVKMMENARKPRDKFLLAILYLTGARPAELLELEADDIVMQKRQIIIRLVTKKLGKSQGFTIRERFLEIDLNSPFTKYITAWAKTKHGRLLVMGNSNVRKIVYRLSRNRFCPYNFRHSRLTKLSRGGASMDELMFWKGSKDAKSVVEYLKAKPIGRKLVID